VSNVDVVATTILGSMTKPYVSLVMSQNGMTQNPSWDIKSLLGRIIQKECEISDSENFALYSGWNFIGIRDQVLFTLTMQIGRVSFVHCLKCNIFWCCLQKYNDLYIPNINISYWEFFVKGSLNGKFIIQCWGWFLFIFRTYLLLVFLEVDNKRWSM
jgi:hypothetical protein